MENKIEIYQGENGQTKINVKFEENTVWLSQKQMAELFDKDTDTIGLHLKNIFFDEELLEIATTEFFSVVQLEGNREVTRKIKLYNLDAIISVGYRVNSKRGVQFRQWATQRLKDYLVQGYAVNEKRLKELSNNLKELENTIQFIKKSGENLESKDLLEIISKYTKSFVLLNQFDSNRLSADALSEEISYEIDYNEAVLAIEELKRQLIEKKEASNLFGNQKDQSFQGILGNVIQSFGGQYVYPSIEEQAAHLLYFIIKNHPFSDGNKRIGAFIFIWFLEKNKHRFSKDGELKINENALTALALLVAQSNMMDKELMIKLIVNLIKS